MKYYLIAGEASGDLHGSNLMRGLLKSDPAARFRFWGGDRMAAAGGAGSTVGSGGMATKIKAARVLMVAGIPMVVCNGRRAGAIVAAARGEDVLQAAISVDEGASHFGEVALVPYDSPISNLKLLFYNTLFDENAACHIAFGEAYPCLKDGHGLSKDELKARGLNDSITHVDFMVGTRDLTITGTTHDGREVPVFVDGNFAL